MKSVSLFLLGICYLSFPMFFFSIWHKDWTTFSRPTFVPTRWTCVIVVSSIYRSFHLFSKRKQFFLLPTGKPVFCPEISSSFSIGTRSSLSFFVLQAIWRLSLSFFFFLKMNSYNEIIKCFMVQLNVWCQLQLTGDKKFLLSATCHFWILLPRFRPAVMSCSVSTSQSSFS